MTTPSIQETFGTVFLSGRAMAARSLLFRVCLVFFVQLFTNMIFVNASLPRKRVLGSAERPLLLTGCFTAPPSPPCARLFLHYLLPAACFEAAYVRHHFISKSPAHIHTHMM